MEGSNHSANLSEGTFAKKNAKATVNFVLSCVCLRGAFFDRGGGQGDTPRGSTCDF